MKQFTFIISALLVIIFDSSAQRGDIIYFTDRNNSAYSLTQPLQYLSPRAIQRRVNQNISIKASDLPVNQWYVDSLIARGADVWYTSKWLNAAIVRNGTDSLISILETLPFVQGSSRVRRLVYQQFEGMYDTRYNQMRVSNFDSSFYGQSYNQVVMLGADTMHKLGFAGQGMLIGVFDSGFPGVNAVLPFDSLRNRGGIKDTYDFVSKNNNVYDDHSHGTQVLGTMAAYLPGSIIGTAYMADYVLYRTEDVATEFRIEEVNWLLAAERADSIGVDVINTSLGYTTFDNTAQNYTYADMNGKTTIISRAAAHAASVGIICVTSAGNEGNGAWNYISAPADADSTLAVGAVGADSIIVSFSSKGPTSDNRTKPDIMARGGAATVVYANGFVGQASGTSFSGPLACGFVAGFWQANPTMTNLEVMERIRNTASRAFAPNNDYGYGIPNFIRAQNNITLSDPSKVENLSIRVFPTPSFDKKVMLEVNSLNEDSLLNITIFDNTGRLLFSQDVWIKKGLNEFVVPQSIRSGVYILKVTLGDRTDSHKLIFAN